MRLRTAAPFAATAVICLSIQAKSPEGGPNQVRPTYVGRALSGPAQVAAELAPDGTFGEFPLPHPNSGPTTITIAPDGMLWFTEGTGNRIGRMAPDGTGLREFELPNAASAPRIITVGADDNIWFTEHLGNRIGRITPDGEIIEFSIPTPNSQPRAIALGADG